MTRDQDPDMHTPETRAAAAQHEAWRAGYLRGAVSGAVVMLGFVLLWTRFP